EVGGAWTGHWSRDKRDLRVLVHWNTSEVPLVEPAQRAPHFHSVGSRGPACSGCSVTGDMGSCGSTRHVGCDRVPQAGPPPVLSCAEWPATGDRGSRWREPGEQQLRQEGFGPPRSSPK
ncbi:hypothetical protein H1C71_039860, partial [Ictidomys tridecemlineatus]